MCQSFILCVLHPHVWSSFHLRSRPHLSYVFSIHMCGALFVFILNHPLCHPATCVVLFMFPSSFILFLHPHVWGYSCFHPQSSPVSSIHMCGALYGPVMYPMCSPSTCVGLFMFSSSFILCVLHPLVWCSLCANHLSFVFSIHICVALYVPIIIYPIAPSTCVMLFICQSFILLLHQHV